MLRRLLLVLSLAFLFGLAQQGAAVHAISHLADWPEHTHQDKDSPHAPVCEKCVVYAQLGNAVGSVHIVHGLQSNHEAIPAPTQSLRYSNHHNPYAARAPPILA